MIRTRTFRLTAASPMQKLSARSPFLTIASATNKHNKCWRHKSSIEIDPQINKDGIKKMRTRYWRPIFLLYLLFMAAAILLSRFFMHSAPLTSKLTSLGVVMPRGQEEKFQ